MEEATLWKQIAGWIWAAIVPIAWWAWDRQDKRMDKLEAMMEEKASVAEFDRQRDNIAKLFDVISEHGERTQAQFSELKDLLLETNVTLLRELNRKQDR